LIAGQYDNPVGVIAFNAAERWSEDVADDIAREIMRRLGLAGDDVPSSLEGFIERHLGSDRQPLCGSPDRPQPRRPRCF
jgi:hypothetical protein